MSCMKAYHTICHNDGPCRDMHGGGENAVYCKDCIHEGDPAKCTTFAELRSLAKSREASSAQHSNQQAKDGDSMSDQPTGPTDLSFWSFDSNVAFECKDIDSCPADHDPLAQAIALEFPAVDQNSATYLKLSEGVSGMKAKFDELSSNSYSDIIFRGRPVPRQYRDEFVACLIAQLDVSAVAIGDRIPKDGEDSSADMGVRELYMQKSYELTQLLKSWRSCVISIHASSATFLKAPEELTCVLGTFHKVIWHESHEGPKEPVVYRSSNFCKVKKQTCVHVFAPARRESLFQAVVQRKRGADNKFHGAAYCAVRLVGFI
jgi:hypothetical protein